MSDEKQEKAQKLDRGEYFKKSHHDLSGLPQGLRIQMRREVNRGPTPEMVARVKHNWAKRGVEVW
jgi:hypothetical protein